MHVYNLLVQDVALEAEIGIRGRVLRNLLPRLSEADSVIPDFGMGYRNPLFAGSAFDEKRGDRGQSPALRGNGILHLSLLVARRRYHRLAKKLRQIGDHLAPIIASPGALSQT